MSKKFDLIEGLDQLKKKELRTAEYYLEAASENRVKGAVELANVYRDLRDSHGEIALHFENQRRELEMATDDGIVGEVWHAFVDAFRAVLSDMPVLFFEDMTHPISKTFLEFEMELLVGYRDMLEKTDGETALLLEKAVEAGRRHVELLRPYVKDNASSN